jgi:hypothetical protein
VARIVELEVEVLADAYNPQLFVRITSDDGLTGVGESWWGTYQPMSPPGTPVFAIGVFVETMLRPLTVGQPCDTVADIEALWQRLVRSTLQYGHEGIVSTAISGVDLAVWDLVAKRQGVPVTALLGPVVHEALPVYASLTWLGTADRVCRDAERALDAGIRAVKLHEANVDLILEVRERLGPGVPLMVDASARFDEAGAITAAERLAAADLVWFEEPVYPQSDHAALARVRAAAPMPIAAGENEFSLAGFERLVLSGAVDILQPEIAKFGGLTPARGIGELADDAGLPLYPHNYSLGPSLLANIHWAMTTPAARWLEVPWLSEGGSFPCGMPMPELVDGCVLPPTAPGLGYTGR